MARTTKKPETEVKLTELQERYLLTRDVKIFQEIFTEILKYARSFVLKTTKNKIYLPPDLVNNAALEATVKFMSQYDKPDFCISTSFGGVLKYKVLEALYNPKQKKRDRIASLNQYIEKRQKSTELGDLSESFNFTYLFRPDSDNIDKDPSHYMFNEKEDAINSVMTVITDLFGSDLGERTKLFIAIGVLRYIKKDSFDDFTTKYLDDKEQDVLNLTLLEVRNRLANIA